MEHTNNLHDFGPFRLDINERVLLRAGRRVPLPAKAVSTLIVLVRNKGHVVEKDDLMKEVWPNEFVEEGNLAQHIFMLRRAFGETADSPKYIETIPRRGYRFLDAAEESNNASALRITSRFTDSSSAHQAYLKGRLCWSKHTREGLEEATKYFRQAIEFDPGFALASAAIVDCYLRLATNYLPPADSLPSAAVAAQAETIEELSPESLASVKLRYEWDQKVAKRELRRATELKSSYPAIHQWSAACVVSQGLNLSGSSRFQSTNLTLAEEVQISCLVARGQIAVGNFEAACLVLKKWYTMGQWPALEKLSPHSFADLLFTAGRLAGSMASTRQVPKAQKHAEALLNGAIGIWEQLGMKRQSAEGQMELGVCYWREGLLDLARNSIQTALKGLGDEDGELRSLGLIRLAINEISAGHVREPLICLNEAASLVEQADPLLTATYNFQMGVISKRLAVAENRDEYFERALEHYREALYQFEGIGNYLYVAFTENNFAELLITLKQLEKAESHIKRARQLYERRYDKVYRAQFYDTQARFYLATEEFDLAEEAIAKSIGTLEESGEEAWLAESLTTQGVLLCRMGRYRPAKRVLQRACQIAERSGNSVVAESALLVLIEEMHDQLENDERLELRAALDRLFTASQQPLANERRGKCLRLIA